MKVKIYPSTLTFDEIVIPASKSMSHRAIMAASLASGKSRIKNINYSVDIKATIEAMKTLGASFIEGENEVIIEGVGGVFSQVERVIDAKESGSTLRFLIPLASLSNCKVQFIGSKRLFQRPNNVYEEIFKHQNNTFEQNDDIVVCGAIQADNFDVVGNVSSQFITGLLYTLPLCEKDSIINIIPPFESRSYVDLTISVLKQYNIDIVWKDENTLFIKGGQHYLPHDYTVEGDYSQLAFFATLGLINGPLTVLGVSHDSLQGDKQFIDFCREMGGKVVEVANGYRFYPSDLKGITMDLNNCPDLGPIASTIASYAKGETKLVNAERLRIKESDRILAMETELKKVGVNVSSTTDSMTIIGPTTWASSQLLSGHNDHRIVMALAIGATIANNVMIIDESEAISKSYPSFFTDLQSLGIKVEYVDEG